MMCGVAANISEELNVGEKFEELADPLAVSGILKAGAENAR
jgi:hypothetical protein